MAEDEFEDSRAASHANTTAGAAALAAATGAAAATQEAREFLRKQSRLSDLQIENVRLQNENLEKLDEYELSHLRWRRFNDQMKGAMQILIVGLGILFVIGIATVIWDASRSDGTVVAAFSVPPSFAQDGIGGDVIANDMTNKLLAIRDVAEGNSLSRSRTVRRDSESEVKVEIPETGISLGEASRYLRLWLGNERRLSGNLRIVGENRIALIVTVDGQMLALTGSRGDLDRMEQKAAEWAFGTVDPANIVLYLSAQRRDDEALAAAARFAHLTSHTELERSDAYSLWSNLTHYATGDLRLAQARAEVSAAIDPRTVAPHMEMLGIAGDLGHDEEMLRQARLIPTMRIQDETPEFQKVGFGYAEDVGRFALDAELGDFARAAQEDCEYACTPAHLHSRRAEYFARLHDPAKAQVLLDEAQALDSEPDPQASRARYFIAAARSDWPAAVLAARAYQAEVSVSELSTQTPGARLGVLRLKTQVWPLLATALARGGNIAAARAAIAGSPPDCYECLRVRGQIDALARNWTAGAAGFARAVKQAPSIPFAYADWGEMLLREGDLGGATAKFEIAHQKGPRFGDPLEMWGEALLAQNRSDLALAKFEEADKYASNWGRLHLKWGEALLYTGRGSEAEKQFVTASNLDMSASDRAALARVRARHG